MNKKTGEIIVGIILVLLIVLASIYLIDLNRMRNNEEVLFSTWGRNYTAPLKEDKKEDIGNEEKVHSFVGTVLEETTKYMVVKPNEDEEESKSSDKIVINYGTDHRDYLYGVGRKVVIYYTGYIMETYPAQINSNEISTDGYEDFEITVKKSNNTQKNKILNNKDLDADKQDFNLYYYGLDEVTVKVNDKIMPLEEALRSGKVTLQGIVAKANKDYESKSIRGDMYLDGGSMEYYYDNYTIIKCHSLNGNRDVYIGIDGMTLNDVEK